MSSKRQSLFSSERAPISVTPGANLPPSRLVYYKTPLEYFIRIDKTGIEGLHHYRLIKQDSQHFARSTKLSDDDLYEIRQKIAETKKDNNSNYSGFGCLVVIIGFFFLIFLLDNVLDTTDFLLWIFILYFYFAGGIILPFFDKIGAYISAHKMDNFLVKKYKLRHNIPFDLYKIEKNKFITLIKSDISKVERYEESLKDYKNALSRFKTEALINYTFIEEYTSYKTLSKYFNGHNRKVDEKISIVKANAEKRQEERRREEIKKEEHKRNIDEIIRSNSNSGDINKVNPFEFEKIVAAIFRNKGYEASVTSKSGDGGVDVIVKKGGKVIYVQCKLYHESTAGAKEIREFYGVMALKNIQEGIFLCTGGFTKSAMEYDNNKLHLFDWIQFQDYVRSLEK